MSARTVFCLPIVPTEYVLVRLFYLKDGRRLAFGTGGPAQRPERSNQRSPPFGPAAGGTRPVPIVDVDHRRLEGCADPLYDPGAPGMEGAAGWQLPKVRWLAAETFEAPALAADGRERVHESDRVGMARLFVEFLARCLLDDLACVHDGDPVGDLDE